MSNLKAQIVALQAEKDKEVSVAVRHKFQRATQHIIESGIAEKATGQGKVFPSFALPNVDGEAIDSDALLAKGPMIVVFYRGGWCPYCNLELQAYQALLHEIQFLGASLVAISPQLPDESFTTAEKAGLEFEVLSDTGNSLAEHLGLVFELSESMQETYLSLGFNLERINGNRSWTLPLPATYVVAQSGEITLAFVNADHTVRLDPGEVIAAIKEL